MREHNFELVPRYWINLKKKKSLELPPPQPAPPLQEDGTTSRGNILATNRENEPGDFMVCQCLYCPPSAFEKL